MRKDGGFTISDRWHMQTQNYQTGQLDRRTLLHKRYQIQRVIGQGGMGAVYQARDVKRQGAVCAIKEMSLSMVPPEEQAQAIQNFKIEAKILWSLNHPNLPVLKGFFSQNQRYFLVMEYIDGLTLEDYLERNKAPFPEKRVLAWARQLCDVLEYLHSQNPPIIFRDMKPGNIMLTRNGQIKLIDFGIARFFRPTEVSDTQLLGTPGFAPPEQYGKSQTDVRSDIYALGITLFQLLTDTITEGFGIEDAQTINPQISTTVARALKKATALEPNERYKNVETFRRALFGEDTFLFESGASAATAEELAELCAQFPDEAADYLAAGEIEVWLHAIGAEKLSDAVARLRTSIPDPQDAVEQFVRGVMKNPRQRAQSNNGNNVHLLDDGADSTVAQLANQQVGARKRAAPIQVSPRTIDFGLVHSGMSAPLLITIHGHQGTQGIVRTSAPWIKIDSAEFDGPSTYIKVHVSSAHLQNHTHYTGSVIIIPDDNTLPEITVRIEADIEEYALQERATHRSKTIVPDMDDEEEDEETVLTTGRSASAQQMGTAQRKAQDGVYDDPYAQATIKDSQTFQWHPWPITSAQHPWQQPGLTFTAAFMLASLLYIALAHKAAAVLPPNAAFIGILAWMIPFASIGALLVQWKFSLGIKEGLNRLFTGMSSVLLLLALLRMACQVLFPQNLGALQLVIMLIGASLAATVGTDFRASKYITENTRWALMNTRRLAQTVAIFIGGGLGFCMTLGFAVGLFTVFGILVGMGVGMGLIWSIDYWLKGNHP